MVKKIDFILPQADRYSQNAIITKWIASGVKKQGVPTRLITPPQDKKKPEHFIRELTENPPACTFCINGILPDKEGNFLADLIQIPHIAYCIDSPTIYYGLCNSDLTTIATIDTEFQNIFSEIKGGAVLFLPGAAPSYIEPVPAIEERSIDILMAPHLIDPDKILDEWSATLPKKMVDFLKDSADMALNFPKETFTSAFLKGWDFFSGAEQAEFDHFRSLTLIYELEMYIRGKDQLQLLKAFDGRDIELVIPQGTTHAWGKLLKGHQANFSFIEGGDFDTLFSKVKDSKIVLHSSPHLKNGTDGAPFISLIGGAYVFSNENLWLSKKYTKSEGISYYKYNEPKKIREEIEHLLSQPQEMDQAILVGRNKVIEEDTWNSRAEQLIKELPSYLTPLKTRAPIVQKGS